MRVRRVGVVSVVGTRSILDTFIVIELCAFFSLFFFFNDTATTEIYTLSLHERSSDLTMTDPYSLMIRMSQPL